MFFDRGGRGGGRGGVPQSLLFLDVVGKVTQSLRDLLAENDRQRE
jgi:hypothetical protein